MKGLCNVIRLCLVRLDWGSQDNEEDRDMALSSYVLQMSSCVPLLKGTIDKCDEWHVIHIYP